MIPSYVVSDGMNFFLEDIDRMVLYLITDKSPAAEAPWLYRQCDWVIGHMPPFFWARHLDSWYSICSFYIQWVVRCHNRRVKLLFETRYSHPCRSLSALPGRQRFQKAILPGDCNRIRFYVIIKRILDNKRSDGATSKLSFFYLCHEYEVHADIILRLSILKKNNFPRTLSWWYRRMT